MPEDSYLPELHSIAEIKPPPNCFTLIAERHTKFFKDEITSAIFLMINQNFLRCLSTAED